jgi:hypothetical protein
VPVLILLVGFLSACGPTPEPDLPLCGPDAIVPPEAGFPMPDRIYIDDLTPTFTWTYPDSSCRPEQYFLNVSESFVDLLGMERPHERHFAIDEVLSGTINAWTPTDPLEPATLYYWQVFTKTGDTYGGGTGQKFFYTGPRCESGTVPSFSAPTLMWPEEGMIYTRITDTHILSWTDTLSCLPESEYLIEISTNPSFVYAESATTGDTFISTSRVISSPLSDCTRYYWRVRMNLEGGVWSAIRSFYTNESGTCAGVPRTVITPIPDGDFPEIDSDASWITGIVWHDLCAVPYASTDVAPPGCVWINDIDGYWANGIYESGEPGLAGVTVDLGAGACPSTGLDTTVTRSDGRYSFGPLDAGTYCVSVNPLSEANISVLIPGSFTFPVRFAEAAEYSITLGGGELSENNNFGWDFQFLPAPSSGAPTAKLLRNANCRRGPSIDYESMTTLFQGKKTSRPPATPARCRSSKPNRSAAG